MKKEVNPVVMWVTLAVVGIAVVIVGFRMLMPSSKMETKGSEADIARVQKGDTFYKPPADAPVPRPYNPNGGNSAPGGTGGSGVSGYNLTPPTH